MASYFAEIIWIKMFEINWSEEHSNMLLRIKQYGDHMKKFVKFKGPLIQLEQEMYDTIGWLCSCVCGDKYHTQYFVMGTARKVSFVQNTKKTYF